MFVLAFAQASIFRIICKNRMNQSGFLTLPTHRRFFLFLLLPLLALLEGCSTNPATGEQNFTAFMSQEKELEIGQQEHPKILKTHNGVYERETMLRYVARVGNLLASHSELPNLQFNFTILNDDMVNAFALPGGYIYITRGLLALAENEAEVAGVLAHEIGHVTARHTAQRYSQAMATNLGLAVLGAVVGNQAVSQAAGFGAHAWLQSYSRGHEMEADQLAVRYMTRAGYDPQGMETFFKKLEQHKRLQSLMAGKNGKEEFSLMSTHPRTSDRIRQAIELARENGAPDGARLGRDAYLAIADGMLYGDDPKQGLRKGRDFIHPGLNFKFTVPPGFNLFNGASKVLAKGPNEATIIFDRADPSLDLRDTPMTVYIRDFWVPRLAVSGLERLTVNGMEAATAKGVISTGSGKQDLRLVAIRHPNTVYRFAFVTPPQMTGGLDTEFRRTTYSFSTLTEQQRRSAQPLRIGVISVHKGDSPQKLSQTLPFEERKLEWFELLNKNLSHRALRPGDKVKVIVH